MAILRQDVGLARQEILVPNPRGGPLGQAGEETLCAELERRFSVPTAEPETRHFALSLRGDLRFSQHTFSRRLFVLNLGVLGPL